MKHPHSRPDARRSRVAMLGRLSRAAVFLGLSAPLLAQFTPADAPDDEITVLSPFEVMSSDSEDYRVNETLAGSRLRSDMKDLGAAIYSLPKTFLDDLAASDLMEIADFLPSVEALTTQEDGQDDNTGVYRAQRFRIRGLFTEALARNYHTVSTGLLAPADSYNTDVVTASVGANAVLFGAANPAGIVESSTLKAIPGRTFGKLLFRTDNYGSQRYELHENLSLADKRAALRVALLQEQRNFFLDPSWKDQERVYVAGKVKLTENTSLSGNFEYYELARNQPYYAGYIDRFGAWADAGMPLVPYTGKAPTGAGIRNYAGQIILTPVYGSAGQSDLLPNWRFHAVSQFKRESVINHNRISTPLDFVGGERNLAGNLRVDERRGWVGDLALEHRFTDDLHMQLAMFAAKQRQDIWTAWTANVVNADANATLPDGSNNPDAGRYFLSPGVLQLRDFLFEQVNFRWTASYDLDLTDKRPWFGRHQFALMAEDRTGRIGQDRGQLFNTDPNRPNANYLAAANKLQPIVYFDPGPSAHQRGPLPDTRTMADYFSTFPNVTAEWKNFATGTYTENFQRSYLAAVQSHFLDRRLVTTAGYRIDQQDVDDVLAGDWATDANGFFLSYRDMKSKVTRVAEISDLSESTYSLGGVFHLLRNRGELDYLSLSYNKSTNFEPSASARDFQGATRANATGVTEDIGLKLGLFGGRLNATLNFFQSGQKNARQDSAKTGVVVNPVNRIWEGLADSLNDDTFRAKVLDGQTVNGDTFDVDARGLEFNLTYSPTPGWRISAMASHNQTELANINPSARRYLADNLAQLRSYGDVVLPDTATVDEVLDDMLTRFDLVLAEAGTRPLNQRDWKFSLNTNYSIRQGALKGLSVGGYFRWEDKSIIGWARDAGNNLELDKPFYAGSFLEAGLSFSHRMPLRDGKFVWINQLNIRNLFDDTDVVPIRAEEDTAVADAPLVYAYNFREPRSFIFTSTLEF